MSDLVHLHVHSYYSLMDGLNSPKELLQAAKDNGQTAIAFTDHGGLTAHREAQKQAKEMGLKPILGLEAYISSTDRFDRRAVKKRDDNTQAYNHIILLAKDAAGYRNLNKLSELAWTEGFYSKPRIDRELLAEYRDGIVVLSGCLNGLIAKAIANDQIGEARILTRWFKNTFEDDFYMEVQAHNPPEINHGLLNLADQFDVKPVVTADCHFARKEDRAVEEAFLILSTNPKPSNLTYDQAKRKGDWLDRFNAIWPDRPISFQEWDLFVTGRADLETPLKEMGIDRTDVFESTLEIADKIGDYEYHEDVDLLPRPRTDSPDDLLARKVWAGMKDRELTGVNDYDGVYKTRVEEELKIIKDKNFASYFLIEGNAVQWAKSKDIMVGPGRGSAAGSLVCYALGITNVDPIKHNLLFFRFINPERNDFPDIDTDFEDKRRGEVKEYMRRQYGNVASIATFGTFAGKSAIKDAAKVFRVPIAEANKATKGADFPANKDFFAEWKKLPQAKEFIKKYPEVVELAQKLQGRIKSIGMHAGGLVVSKEPINNYAPIQSNKDTMDDTAPRVPVVALDMEQIADIGLIKYDFLGLKALSVVHDTVRAIKDRQGIDIDLDNLPMDDPKVYQMLSDGYTRGVFQCEQQPYTKLLIKMGGVSTFDELVASNALVRPGATNSSAGANFIARKNGEKPVKYPHESMEWFTKETYGTIIYQEQVMLTMTELAGMKMSTADKVRKIIGKKKDVSEFEQYKAEFIEGASQNVSRPVAEGLWRDFEAHADYSFNKSHSVAYGMLSYWTAYLKANFPLEFMWANLYNEKDKDSRLDYLMEAKRLGIRIKLPHVNDSEENFAIQSDDNGDFIRFGLINVKNIAHKAAMRIIENRPFTSYQQLLDTAYVKGSGISTRIVASLDAIGAATFPDHPRTGNERENFFEYLAIPAFEVKDLNPRTRAQFRDLDDYDPEDAFICMGMVRSIKRGTGWALVSLVDESGSAGVFTDEQTTIEPGNIYVFLVANNRIAKYVSMSDLSNDNGDSFQEFLEAESFEDVPDGMLRVVHFASRKTKAGKNMANVIFSDRKKNLVPALVFDRQFHKAYAKCKEGEVVDVLFNQTKDGATVLENVL